MAASFVMRDYVSLNSWFKTLPPGAAFQNVASPYVHVFAIIAFLCILNDFLLVILENIQSWSLIHTVAMIT